MGRICRRPLRVEDILQPTAIKKPDSQPYSFKKINSTNNLMEIWNNPEVRSSPVRPSYENQLVKHQHYSLVRP